MPTQEWIQAAERQIVEAVVDRALRLGYGIAVWNGGDLPELDTNVDREQILEALFATDEETLELRTADGAYYGFVRFVYGNDGWDVLCDHSASMDADGFMTPVNEVIERLETEAGAA